MFKRIIGKDYMTRYHLIPRNQFLNVYLHNYQGSDEPTPHDHPWWSVSILLKGTLIEHRPGRPPRRIRRWLPVLRSSRFQHWLEILRSGDTWTLFITGPRTRTWWFYPPLRSRIHHADYIRMKDMQ